MASIYILHSATLNKFYTGSCLDLNKRLEEHKTRKYSSAFTAKADDWKLYWSADNITYAQARRIEFHIKKMHSKQYILNLKKHHEIFEKLLALK